MAGEVTSSEEPEGNVKEEEDEEESEGGAQGTEEEDEGDDSGVSQVRVFILTPT